MSRRFATASRSIVVRFIVSRLIVVRFIVMAALSGHAAPGRRDKWAVVGNASRMRGRLSGEAGMSTAEYAVGTIAACAFAAVLYQVVTGDSIVSALRGLIDSALSTLS